jgi:hypothetical protein
MSRQRALAAVHLQPADRIPHLEIIQHPDFEQALTGLDPYQHPQQARLAMLEKLDVDLFFAGVPATDDPIENPFADGASSKVLADGRRVVRWGATCTGTWDWGKGFTSVKQVLDYDPLQHLPAGTVEDLSASYQASLDRQRELVGDRYLETGGTYMTLFMWPVMTFGWELFLEAAASEPKPFKELMEGFAQVSERVFTAWSRTDVEVVTSHDDLCMARGTVFSPAWLEEVVYPQYARFWKILQDAGKKVIFISDGRVNPVAEAVFACGADGLFAEPHTDLEPLVEKYGDSKILMGNVDTRVLSYGDRAAIEAEVKRCVEMGRGAPGYFIGVTNEITYNAPVENVMAYFDFCERYGGR